MIYALIYYVLSIIVALIIEAKWYGRVTVKDLLISILVAWIAVPIVAFLFLFDCIGNAGFLDKQLWEKKLRERK